MIANINALANAGIRVAIRLNYDKDNIADILKLIDYLGIAITNKSNVLAMDILCSVTIPILLLMSAKMHLNLLTSIVRLCKMTFAAGKMYLICILSKQNAMHVSSLFSHQSDGKLAKCSMAMEERRFHWRCLFSLSLEQCIFEVVFYRGFPHKNATPASFCHCVKVVARPGTLATLM